MNSKHEIRKYVVAAGVLCLWGIVILVGGYRVLVYENRPGMDTHPSAHWPRNSKVELDRTKYTLVMVVHPKCSCSKASIGELSRLMARYGTVVHAEVLFVVPEARAAEWSQSQNWDAAAAVQGVDPVLDVNGALAKRFGAETSGLTLLYDRAGKLLFAGGITASRGHWGDNTGSDAIGALLEGRSALVGKTPAFGCGLFDEHTGA